MQGKRRRRQENAKQKVLTEQIDKLKEDQLTQITEEALNDPLVNLIKMVKPDYESENKRKIKIHSKIK